MTKVNKSTLAITAISIIALACISQKINGQILYLAIGAIAGLAGYDITKNGEK